MTDAATVAAPTNDSPAPSPVEGEVERYCLTRTSLGLQMVAQNGGTWVKFADHRSSLAAARAEVERMKAENSGLRDQMKAAVAVVMAVQDWIDKDGSNASHHHLLVCAANYTTGEKGAGK